MQRVTTIVGAMAVTATVCLGVGGCSTHKDPGPSSASRQVEPFHWVAGHWEDAAGSGAFEEGWFGERGGAMVDVFRLVGAKGPIVYEFMRTAMDADRLVMEITHFRGNGTRWPDQPVVFRSTALGDDRVEFALDGMPNKTLVYERTGTDTMRVTLNDPEDAKPSVFEFVRKK